MKDDSTNYRRPRLTRHPAVWWSRVKVRWPFAVWLLIAILAIAFYVHGVTVSPVQGLAKAYSDNISPLETGSLIAVLVQEGQTVKAGDVVAEMDPTLIDSEIAILEAQLAEERGDVLRLDRQFSAAVVDAETALANERARQAADKAELKILTDELKRLKEAYELGLATAGTLVPVLARQSALEGAVAFFPEIMRTYELHQSQAREQYGNLKRFYLAVEDSPEKIAVENYFAVPIENVLRSIRLLRKRKDLYRLRAPRDGVVSRVEYAIGAVVPSGEPIIRVAGTQVTSVIVFLSESRIASHLQVDTTVRITSVAHPHTSLVGTVAVAGPEVLALPARVSPIPNQPMRGRRITVLLQGENNLLHNENVSVRPVVQLWKRPASTP